MTNPSPESMEKGVQPLDEIMTRLGIANSALVKASTEQLTHKVVAKGRKGRKLTINLQMKIFNAINALDPEKQFTLKQLFNY